MAEGKNARKTESGPVNAVAGEGLFSALRSLDRLLETALTAQSVRAQPANPDTYRGFYIREEDVSQLLSRPPGQPLLAAAGQRGEAPVLLEPFPRLERLAERFALEPVDAALVLIALAAEADLRYERIFAYLQDDVTRRRPTLDLALDLLCRTAEEKFTARGRLAGDAPLVRHSLLQLAPDPNHVHPPALSQYLKLDEPVARWLMGEDDLDARLVPFCELIRASELDTPPAAEMSRRVVLLAAHTAGSGQTLRMHLHGLAGSGKRGLAAAVAHRLGKPLLVADLARLPGPAEFESAMRLLFREARLQDAVLYAGSLHALRADAEGLRLARLVTELAGHPNAVILGDTGPCPTALTSHAGVMIVTLPPLDFPARKACWEVCLGQAEISLAPDQLEALAARFRLTSGQIAGAVRAASAQARGMARTSENGKSPRPALDQLFAAVRAQSGEQLRALTRKIEPRYRWNDLILPPDQHAHLREVCAQAQFCHLVYGDWGFGRKLSLGKGLNALFSGPPGTGKTMAAEVIAHELGLDLYKIDLSQVVSKYIGETEKNLDRIFTAAENSNAILLFDEADALFGKRSEVKDAHDRYANVEVGYLLQKMEEYEGIAVLATNLRSHMDDAFVRRMHAIVEFPFPDEELRRRIWQVVFPRETPLGDDVDFTSLAREVRLAGGNIRNIALSAAFYAAADGRTVRMAHLLRAARREYQKLGRSWTEPQREVAAPQEEKGITKGVAQ